MWWMLLAQGAASAAQTAQSNKANQRAIKAENKVRARADKETIANTAQAITAVNVQNGQLRVDAARQLQEAEVAAYAATGSTVANAAAAGVRGASVDATLGDINRELGAVEVRVEQNLEVQQYNLTNRVRELIAGASASLRGQQDPYARDQNPLLAGLITAGSQYLNNYMQFGAGKGTTGGVSAPSGAQSFGAPDTTAGMTFSTGT